MAKYSVLKITKEGSNGWQSSSAYSDLDDLMDNSHFEKSPFKVELDNKMYYLFQKGLWSDESIKNPVITNTFVDASIQFADFFIGIKDRKADLNDLKLNGIRFTTITNQPVDSRNDSGGIFQTACIYSPSDIAFVNVNSPLVKDIREDEKIMEEFLKAS
tara:strand:+ start:250 stop:726 length:477 start_codon:yes stop_codon:yes gene_type:complete